jgi:hypothetical protein
MKEINFTGEITKEFGFYYSSNPFLNEWLLSQEIEAETKYINEDTQKVTWSYKSDAELRKNVSIFREQN